MTVVVLAIVMIALGLIVGVYLVMWRSLRDHPALLIIDTASELPAPTPVQITATYQAPARVLHEKVPALD